MGSAASTQSLLTSELAKPLDANDLDEKAAKAEVVRLRSLLRQHEQALLKSSMATAGGGGGTTRASLTVKISPAVAPAETEASQGAPVKSPNGCKSPYSRADVAKFDNNHAASFNVEDCPQIRDYLINEFSRFAGADQVLEWDEFWRFMQNLELRLSDQEIATLRQKADINHDGVIEWEEMLTVVQPVLGKYWQAQLHGAPEYTHWTELHWETHHTVQKDGEGYTRKGTPFYVNKVTGQNSWEKPGILTRHASIDELKKDRNMQQAPSLEAVLKHAFDKHSTSGVVLSRDQFWKIVTEELHLDPALSQPELRDLMANADLNKDGAIDRNVSVWLVGWLIVFVSLLRASLPLFFLLLSFSLFFSYFYD